MPDARYEELIEGQQYAIVFDDGLVIGGFYDPEDARLLAADHDGRVIRLTLTTEDV